MLDIGKFKTGVGDNGGLGYPGQGQGMGTALGEGLGGEPLFPLEKGFQAISSPFLTVQPTTVRAPIMTRPVYNCTYSSSHISKK